MFIKIHSQPSTKPKSPPSEDTVGVRARGALSIYLKGENSEMKSSVRNLARIRSGRNNPWYKLMEVAKLGLGSARMRGYAALSRGYAQTQDAGFKLLPQAAVKARRRCRRRRDFSRRASEVNSAPPSTLFGSSDICLSIALF